MVETRTSNREFEKLDTKYDQQVKGNFDEGSSQTDGLKLLMEDHREVFNLYDNQFSKTDDLEKKREIIDKMITELSKHSAVEEMILYPMMRLTLEKGESYYQDSIKDHQELKENLQKILDTDCSDKSWLSIVDNVMSDLREHIDKEEKEIFQELRSKLTQSQLSLLYSALSAGKLTAPTRPHAWSGSGMQQWFAGPPLAAFDKLKETFGWSQQ